MTRSGLVLLSSVFLAAACDSDDGSAMDASGGGTEASGTSDGPTSDTQPDPTGDTDTSDSATSGADETGDPPVEEEDVPARGISVSRVEANSGVAIPIAIDGAWADGSVRTPRSPRTETPRSGSTSTSTRARGCSGKSKPA